MYVIDTHAHLDEVPDLAQALDEARATGIVAIIAVGQDLASDEKVLALAQAHPDIIYPALGLHPWNIKTAELERTFQFILDHAADTVAIGEVGLDYHKKVLASAGKELQQQTFRQVLKIARAAQKPVIIHSRYAWRDALTLVEESGVEKAVFHWYTGTSSVLRDIIARGYFLSATPAIEYHEEHRRAIKETPLDRLLLETDSPVTYRYQKGQPYEARPAHALISLKYAAELKGLSEAELAAATTINAQRLFGLPITPSD